MQVFYIKYISFKVLNFYFRMSESLKYQMVPLDPLLNSQNRVMTFFILSRRAIETSLLNLTSESKPSLLNYQPPTGQFMFRFRKSDPARKSSLDFEFLIVEHAVIIARYGCVVFQGDPTQLYIFRQFMALYSLSKTSMFVLLICSLFR